MAESAPSLPAMREWAGEPPWPTVDAAEVGQSIVACYYVETVEQLRTKHEKPYLKLRLFDRHGGVDGRVWEDADRVAERIQAGHFVGIRGRVEAFKDQRQLKVEQIARVHVGVEDLGLFLPRSRRDPEVMAAELDAIVASLADAPLRALLQRLLGAESETGRGFRQAPAAKRNHHAYVGGLLEHTLSVVGVCDALARHYGAPVDRDLLVAGALLHDIGKIREIGVEAGFPYTDEGKLLGHILLGLQLVADEAREVADLTDDRRLLLLHLIASHQGRYEWQSPREPRVIEALILHYADDLDAKMCQALGLVGAVEQGWTSYDRGFGREFYRHRPIGPDAPGLLDPPATGAAGPGRDDPLAATSGEPGRTSAGPEPTLDLFTEDPAGPGGADAE